MENSDALCKDVLSSIHEQLLAPLASASNFVEGYQKRVYAFYQANMPSRAPSSDTPVSQILNILCFLNRLFTSQAIAVDSLTFDQIICFYLGHKDENVATICTKLVRWRLPSILKSFSNTSTADFYWSIVFDLQPSSSKIHSSNAYIMWLRFLKSSAHDWRFDQHFQDCIITQGFFWEIIQRGLVSTSHETKKYCLSILQLALKSINTSFSTSLIEWNNDNSKVLLHEWSRYTTMYELMGIDTSLHQTKAAFHEILALITPDSSIHPSWGFCLLATGFKASIDSVRKFSASILLSIKPEHLHLLRYGLPYLEESFLPYMLLARHFAVREVDAGTNRVHCDHGTKLSNFIAAVFHSLRTKEEYESVAYSVLCVLDRIREGFAAPRIYASIGLVDGLASKKVLQFGKHDAPLLRLFENFCEGVLYERVIQTLNLRILLSFQIGTLSTFGWLLAKFNIFNGHKIFSANVDIICDYLEANGVNIAQIMDHLNSNIPIDEAVLFSRLALNLNQMNNDVISYCCAQNNLFIAKLLESGFPLSKGTPELHNTVSNLVSDACNDQESDSVYEALCSTSSDLSSIRADQSLLRNLWASIQQELSLDDFQKLKRSYLRLRFFNKAVACSAYDFLNADLLSVIEASKTIGRMSTTLKSTPGVHKLKEGILGELYNLASIFLSQRTIGSEEFASVLPIMNFRSTSPTVLIPMLTFIENAFDQGSIIADLVVTTIVGLSEVVEELCGERFRLIDKDLHVKIIEIMFHPFVMRCCIDHSTLNDCLLTFSDVIIENSPGRRSLMPTMMKLISDFQVEEPALFEQLLFLPKLLVEALKLIQLSNSVFKIESIIGKLYDEKLSPQRSASLYFEIYGVEEVAYKVWMFAVANSITTSDFACLLLDIIFEDDEHNSFQVIKSTDCAEEYSRSQLAKLVISMIDKIESKIVTDKYIDRFIDIVENDPSPLVRVYFEWAIAQHLLRVPSVSDIIFAKVSSSLVAHTIKPITVTAYERILFLMIQSMDEAILSEYMNKLLTLVLPAACTNKAVTRHFSMSMAISIFGEIRRKNLKVEKYVYEMLDHMYQNAVATGALGQYRNGDASFWDAERDLDLIHISGGLLLRLNDRTVEFITETEFRTYLLPGQIEILSHPIGHDREDVWMSTLRNDLAKSSLQESSDDYASPLQTKSGAWNTVMDVDQGSRGADIVRSDLIVVASLVDKAPNLGGICRLCDVLGAGLMTLHDEKIKTNPQFKNVAVTADYWMPMTEVKPDEIVKFLYEKKLEGYTLIGLEQTDKSVVLNRELKFPKKSLILLGREKEGIPGELLAELDFCVEIKQVGVIRSMNIQTAAAVIVHAYSSQQC